MEQDLGEDFTVSQIGEESCVPKVKRPKVIEWDVEINVHLGRSGRTR